MAAEPGDVVRQEHKKQIRKALDILSSTERDEVKLDDLLELLTGSRFTPSSKR